MDDDEANLYPVIGGFRGMVRKPRLLQSGNVAEFFVGNDGEADAVLALGMSKYQDAEVYVRVYLIKHPDGQEARLLRAPDDEKKPHADLASMLYSRGFFKGLQIQAAIKGTKDAPKPEPGASQSQWGKALASELGYPSMGYVPPDSLLDWAEVRELAWLLPRAYRDYVGGDHDDGHGDARPQG